MRSGRTLFGASRVPFITEDTNWSLGNSRFIACRACGEASGPYEPRMMYSIPSTFWLPTKIPGVFLSASVSCGVDGKEMSKSPDSIALAAAGVLRDLADDDLLEVRSAP